MSKIQQIVAANTILWFHCYFSQNTYRDVNATFITSWLGFIGSLLFVFISGGKRKSLDQLFLINITMIIPMLVGSYYIDNTFVANFNKNKEMTIFKWLTMTLTTSDDMLEYSGFIIAPLWFLHTEFLMEMFIQIYLYMTKNDLTSKRILGFVMYCFMVYNILNMKELPDDFNLITASTGVNQQLNIFIFEQQCCFSHNIPFYILGFLLPYSNEKRSKKLKVWLFSIFISHMLLIKLFLELSSNPFIVFILVSMCILGVSEFDTIQEKLTTVFL